MLDILRRIFCAMCPLLLGYNLKEGVMMTLLKATGTTTHLEMYKTGMGGNVSKFV